MTGNTSLSLPAFPFGMGPYGTSSLAYDAFRTSNPICQVLVPSGQKVWLVTRYEDVCTVHKDSMFSRAEAVRTGAAMVKDAGLEVEAGVLQNTDGERHSRLRKVFASHYSQDQVTRWTEIISKEARETIQSLKGKRTFDLRSDFFEPVARRSAQEIFGFPISQRTQLLELFFNAAMMIELRKQISTSFREGPKPIEGSYLGLLGAACKNGHITESELLMNLIVIMTVTFDAIGGPFLGGVFALLRDYDQWELCLQQRSLLSNAVDEMLRSYPNGDGQFLRVAVRGTRLHGVEINPGDVVLAPVSAANADPQVFFEPRRYNVQRPNTNKHVAFGVGRHRCIGSLLVSVWMRTALEALLDHLPSLRLAVPPAAIRYRSTPLINIIDKLPVTH
jgi:cytochrome P450